MSAVFATFATSPVYLRLRKDCSRAAHRRWGPIAPGCSPRQANSV